MTNFPKFSLIFPPSFIAWCQTFFKENLVSSISMKGLCKGHTPDRKKTSWATSGIELRTPGFIGCHPNHFTSDTCLLDTFN